MIGGVHHEDDLLADPGDFRVNVGFLKVAGQSAVLNVASPFLEDPSDHYGENGRWAGFWPPSLMFGLSEGCSSHSAPAGGGNAPCRCFPSANKFRAAGVVGADWSADRTRGFLSDQSSIISHDPSSTCAWDGDRDPTGRSTRTCPRGDQVALLSDWILSCDVIGGASATKFPDGVLCERGVGMVCGCAAVKRRSSDHASLRSVSSDPDSPSCVVLASLGQFVFNLLSNLFIEFAADTAVVGHISNDEAYYRTEVKHLAKWFSNNNLSLNVEKTKEIITDCRRTHTLHTPLTINGVAVEGIQNSEPPPSPFHWRGADRSNLRPVDPVVVEVSDPAPGK
nr:PREDICTED: uncharacterized protein LOC102198487 [Pundamilia nyererei]